MYQWIESIRVEDGQVLNLIGHQKRMDETFKYFASSLEAFSLHTIVQKLDLPPKGIFKLRLIYSLSEIVTLEITPYSIQAISKFYLIEQPDISYPFKFRDRCFLNSLEHEDAEPIIVQNGLITDTRYSNLIFYNGEGWFTPTTYLLNGTMRQQLLFDGAIRECDIGINNLSNYSHFKMINAMMSPEYATLYDIASIVSQNFSENVLE